MAVAECKPKSGGGTKLVINGRCVFLQYTDLLGSL